MIKKEESFTIVELIVVVIIIGILATLGITQYLSSREQALNKEAQVNLKLILAAERVYRMENIDSKYVPADSVALVNQYLRLLLPQGDNRAWDYVITTSGGGTDFCVQSTRTGTVIKHWKIVSPTIGTPDPQPEEGTCP